MATYLNAGIKKRIKSMVINKAMKAQYEYLKLLEYDVAKHAYDILYKEWEEHVLALPNYIAPIQSYITFIVLEDGSRRRYCLDLQSNKKFVPIKYELMDNPEITDKRFLDDLKMWDDFKRKLANEKVNWSLSIDALLEKTRTFEALYKKWPEVKEIAKEFEPATFDSKAENPDPKLMNRINASLKGEAQKNAKVQQIYGE